MPGAGAPVPGSWRRSMRRVMSEWLPNWPITRLRSTHPTLARQDEPVATVLSEAGIRHIAAANAAAAAAGLGAGQPLADATTHRHGLLYVHEYASRRGRERGGQDVP